MPEHRPPRHAAVVLAAGRSHRFGARKQLLLIDGEPLVRRAARAVLATRPLATRVVIGRDADDVRAALDGLDLACIECDADRMAQSLRAGLAATDAGADGALVVLADQPALSALRLQQLVEAWQAGPERAVACRYDGIIGVPALLPRAWFTRWQGAGDDEGARALLRADADAVVAIDAAELAFDIDTPGDAARWLRSAPER